MQKGKREMPVQFQPVMCRLWTADGALLVGGFLVAGPLLVTSAAVIGSVPGKALSFDLPFLEEGRRTAVLQQVKGGMALLQPDSLPSGVNLLAKSDFVTPAVDRDLICAAFTEAYPDGVHFSAAAHAPPDDGAFRVLARSGIDYAAQPLHGGLAWDAAAGRFCGMLRSRPAGFGWVTELVEMN